MRDRAEELNVPRLTFDDASGLAVSHLSKIHQAGPVTQVGEHGRVLQTIGKHTLSTAVHSS
jgi:hypothetical protein